jgi:hypothetical protein
VSEPLDGVPYSPAPHDATGYDPELGYHDAPYVPNLSPVPLPALLTDHPPTPTYPSLEPASDQPDAPA